MARPKTSKLQRSEVTTVRFDPKLRYLIELAARTQRRTVSSFLEWAAEQAVNNCVLSREMGWSAEDGSRELVECTVGNHAELLWDVDEPDRLAKLALRYPSLLTYTEQVIWKRIREDADVWKDRQLDFPMMRSRWTTYADGVSDAAEE